MMLPRDPNSPPPAPPARLGAVGTVRPRFGHIVDLENQLGGPARWSASSMRGVPDSAFQEAAREYQRRWVRSHDLIWAACDVSRFGAVAPCWPTACLRPGFGPDGSEDALLEIVDSAALARGCDHVMLASGDGKFTKLVAELCELGVPVTVVGWPGGISAELLAMAHRVIHLSQHPLVAA